MGTEIVFPIALLIWVLSIVLISYRMIITKRKVAFWLVLIGGIFSIFALFLRLGASIFLVLELEFIAAVGVGLIALVISRRWQISAIYATLGFIYLSDKFDGNEHFELLTSFEILTAPIFIALSIVFCVGAFWENRYPQTHNN